ncbi:MAG: glyoxalase [Actinomycetota bacterium]|nr:glyoxalase [Actinomycetota bacterium]
MDVLFVAGFSPIVRDVVSSRSFYQGALGLPLEGDDYPSTEKLDGLKHMGLWPLADAAKSCFGTEEWPEGTPVPQGTIEFEVADVDAAAREMEAAGSALIHGARTEPWGQTVARLLSPEGLLVGLTFTPLLHAGS